MLNRVPIRIRVAAAFAIAMTPVLAGTGLYVYDRTESQLKASLNDRLAQRAADLSTVVNDPSTSLAEAGQHAFIERGESFAQLLDVNGNVVDASRQLMSTPLLSASQLADAQRRPIYADHGPVPGLDESSRLLATRVTRDEETDVLVVGATREGINEQLDTLRDVMLTAGPVGLALATLVGYLLAGMSLRQVDRMRRDATSISAETAGERLAVPPTRDELQSLAETLNDMLSRLEAGMKREQGFVADASHELRTPLALLRTELELALHHSQSPAELREAVRRSVEEVDRLAQLADDLLLMATSDRGTIPLRVEAVDISEVMRSVGRRFEWRAAESGREIDVQDGPDLYVTGDRIRLEQALVNLVDNALRHGEGPVRIFAERRGEAVEVHVADRGQGFPPDYLGHAFERFSRPDVSRTSRGSGLGLSIVRVIAQAHGGTAHIRNVVGGGADAWLTLTQASSGRSSSLATHGLTRGPPEHFGSAGK